MLVNIMVLVISYKIAYDFIFRYLVSGSSDGLAYAWNTNIRGSELVRKPIATLKGHEAEVTCVEFSKVIYRFQSSFDWEVVLFTQTNKIPGK